MSPLDFGELLALGRKILDTHGVAFRWRPGSVITNSQFREIVRNAAEVQIQDRARHTITEVVKVLDRLLEDGR